MQSEDILTNCITYSANKSKIVVDTPSQAARMITRRQAKGLLDKGREDENHY
jgi:hypothetical protein